MLDNGVLRLCEGFLKAGNRFGGHLSVRIISGGPGLGCGRQIELIAIVRNFRRMDRSQCDLRQKAGEIGEVVVKIVAIKPATRNPGTGKGIWMSADFDQPLADFAEYM